MTRELLAVEYISKGESKKEGADALHFLDGCRGEVCKKAWIKAKQSARQGGPIPHVMARFSLAFPGNVLKLYPNWGFGDEDLEEQGLRVPVTSLRPVAKTPISKFTPIRWTEEMQVVQAVFEKDSYIKINSMSDLFTCFGSLEKSLQYCWAWYSESGEGKNVFMQARIYGIDKLIASYAPSKFNGVAIQIFTRPIKETVERMRSDVYLFSNTEEYVNYIDGVEIKRQLVGKGRWSPSLQGKYPKENFKSAKEFLSKEDKSSKEDEEKLLAAMAAATRTLRYVSSTASTSLSFLSSNTSSTTY
jgi:hypothetical protein